MMAGQIGYWLLDIGYLHIKRIGWQCVDHIDIPYGGMVQYAAFSTWKEWA